jgi:hypothetical protein
MPQKEVPIVIDFESPEYDAQFGDAQRADLLQGVLEYVLARADEGINTSAARRSVIEDAVDSVLESSLVAIDMLYVERDDQVGTACKHTHFQQALPVLDSVQHMTSLGWWSSTMKQQ